MNGTKIAIAGLLACTLAPAWADDIDGGPARAGTAGTGVRVMANEVDTTDGPARAGAGGNGVRVMSNVVITGDGAGRFLLQPQLSTGPVKDAPYSALVVSEHLQALADGNQIATRHATMNYRDSAGRTRTEVQGEDGAPQLVSIDDPVAGVRYILDPKDMSVAKLPRRGDFGRSAAEAAAAAQARIEQLRKEGKLPTVERRNGPDGEEIIVKHVQRDGAEATRKALEEVRIKVGKVLEDGRLQRELHTQLAPLIASSLGDMKWARNATTKELGTREFDGVKAEGKQRSYTIPAGAVGNRNPIVVSDETWYAPDLRIVVLARHSDPRSGETTTRAENIRRGEPAPALFTVPAGYKPRDGAAVRAGRVEWKDK